MDMESSHSQWGALAVVASIGAAIGIGQLLVSPEPLRWRYAIGRAIVSSGISMAAFTMLAWIPDAPLPLLVGGACLLASLGTSGLSMLAARVFRVPPQETKE